jgi:nucleoid-associated protein YgaU
MVKAEIRAFSCGSIENRLDPPQAAKGSGIMGVNPLRAFFFLAGGLSAGLVIAYFAGAFDGAAGRPPATIAALPDQAATAKGDRPSSDQTLPAAPEAGTAPEPADAAKDGTPAATPEQEAPQVQTDGSTTEQQPAESAASLAPTFDLVRVEPDGSLLVAGKAAPMADVELITTGSALAVAKAETGGDFVVILDDPLKPGEYQFSLKATLGGVETMSIETALVSVPDRPGGQVLAMIDEPGRPTQVLTAPEPATGGATTDQAGATAQQVAPEAPAPQEQAAASEATTEETAAPAAGDAPAVAQDVAQAPSADQAPTAEQHAQAEHQIRIEAVEIEGSKVFVAGSASAGRLVRVYADDALLGENRSSAGDRFLVEAERDIAVGDHIIRADLIGERGDVLARAVVPFEREPGTFVAAVAPQEGQASTTAAPPSSSQDAPAATSLQAPTETAAAPATQPVETGPAGTGAGSAATSTDAAQPQTAAASQAATAPKLEPAASAVIIRRGDSLWRISRRIYGRGVRYSTIYLANQDQIRNPDRIWPGQVFAVPEKTNEGEAADMSAVGEQATTR